MMTALSCTGALTTERKIGTAENKSAHSAAGGNLRKLEESTEEFKHKTVPQNLAKSITQVRH